MSEIAHFNCNNDRVRAGLRWFGPEDPVTIQHIRQTPGITHVISALHHIPAGAIWSEEEIAKRKIEIEFIEHEQAPEHLCGMDRFEWYQQHGQLSGLIWDTAESLIFTEEIKNGNPLRDEHIEHYNESLRNLGRFGVINVIGNFMLVADWTRTGLTQLHDGSESLQYVHAAFAAFDIYLLKRHKDEQGYLEDNSYTQHEITAARAYWQEHLSGHPDACQRLTDMITAGLPGAQAGFTLDDFRQAISAYKGMSESNLRDHISYFLSKVVPVAKEAGVRLCCHSDDPAFTPFLGTPRTVGSAAGYKFLLDHGCGANFCMGSLMAHEKNRDITGVLREIVEYGRSKQMSIDEIFPHIHMRPIETEGKNFREGHHADHRRELAKVVYTLVDLNWKGVFRPDHAPSSQHGLGRPGYDVIGRGYGANLLLGLFEMATMLKESQNETIEALIQAGHLSESERENALNSARRAVIDSITQQLSVITLPPAYDDQDEPIDLSIG